MHDVRSGVSERLDHILIRLPNWLGDVLMARPLLHDLRAAYPGSELRAIAPPGVTALLQGERVLNALDPWPGRGNQTAVGNLRSRLRAWGPDGALVLPPSFSSAWFVRSTGASLRVGYAHEGRSWTLSRALRRPARGDLHLSDEYRRLGGALAGAGLPDTVLPDLPVPAGADEEARAALDSNAREDEPWVVLGPGAIYGPAKRWSPDRFAEVGRRWGQRGHRVLVCGTAAERDTCSAVARAIGNVAIDLSGRTSLDALAWLCGRARHALCNDSGLAHLCAALGTPTVVVFGSTSSAWTAPLGRRVRVLQDAPVCSPCFRRTCSIGYPCLENVTVDAVVGAMRESPA